MEEITKDLFFVAQKIDELFNKFFLPNSFPSNNLLEAMKYSTLGGGKKFRPFLIYAFSKKLQVSEEVSLYIGACIEMLHSYTLIHDDLPCMDDDNERRNKPSSHIKFNEFTAVLAGDALQTEAFYLLSSNNLNIDTKEKIEIINVIAKAMGAKNLISGQMLDLEFAENNNINILDLIKKIHILKTAKLISLCTLLPGIIAKKSSDYQKSLAMYGEQLGLIYQIVDDFKDSKSNEPLNIVNILGKNEAKQQIKELDTSCKKLLKDLKLEDLAIINDYILKDFYEIYQ